MQQWLSIREVSNCQLYMNPRVGGLLSSPSPIPGHMSLGKTLNPKLYLAPEGGSMSTKIFPKGINNVSVILRISDFIYVGLLPHCDSDRLSVSPPTFPGRLTLYNCHNSQFRPNPNCQGRLSTLICF